MLISGRPSVGNPNLTRAYYNEHDPFSAGWLEGLISSGLIAPGDVDRRDIQEVRPDDLRGYTQCHFFAGIGGWSRALRLAGWSDSRPVWTGSCPCQGFSSAGKGRGFSDPRHLWPEWFRLIRECRPQCVFGEQVEAAVLHGWLDLISSDLEGEGYAVGAAVLGAHSVGAPHRRQRLWFVGSLGISEGIGHEGECLRAAGGRSPDGVAEADAGGVLADPFGSQEHEELSRPEADERGRDADGPGGCGLAGGLADAAGGGRQSVSGEGRICGEMAGKAELREQSGDRGNADNSLAHRDETGLGADAGSRVHDLEHHAEPCGESRDLADSAVPRQAGSEDAGADSGDAGAHSGGSEQSERGGDAGIAVANPANRGQSERNLGNEAGAERTASGGRPERYEGRRGNDAADGGHSNFWSGIIWLPCRDGKLRPAQPGIFPLAHGIPSRVGLLRGAGNAIVPQVGAEFISAYRDIIENRNT